MIRESRTDDMASILTLWMESTIYAHPFIEARYWRESEPIVRDVYLPAAQTWVWEEAGLLKGFASVMEARFWARCLSRRTRSAAGLARRWCSMFSSALPHSAWRFTRKISRR